MYCFKVCASLSKFASYFLYSYREPRGLEVRGGTAIAPMTLSGVVHATSAFRRRAAYGNRTRLLGLGSRCTTDVLMPQNRCKSTIFFSIVQIYDCFFVYSPGLYLHGAPTSLRSPTLKAHTSAYSQYHENRIRLTVPFIP